MLSTLSARLSLNTSKQFNKSFITEKGVTVDGVIDVMPEHRDNWQVFTVVTDDKRIKIYTDRYTNYRYGDTLRLVGNISSPRNFRSENGREFDYINFLLKDGICCEMKKPVIEKREEESKSSLVKEYLFSFKEKFLRNINQSLGEPHASLASGLVIGVKSGLGKDLIDKFRIVGLIHIVVLSGYNITIVSDMIRRLLSLLPRSLGIVAGMISIILFAILVGEGATVIRSSIMAIIALSAGFTRRDYRADRALLIAGWIMVMQNPSIILHDPSFQLSFTATLGLIAFASPLEKKFSWITEKYGLRGLFASTLATQISVAPLILYMMGNISIIGMFANIFVLPIVPLTMLSVALTGLSGFISQSISTFFGWISHLLLGYELLVVNYFSLLPMASIEIPPFPLWVVVSIYLIYFIFYFTFLRKPSQLETN
jgi:competence protein ComEC